MTPALPRSLRLAVAVACAVAGLVALGAAGRRIVVDNPWLAPPFTTPPYDRHIDEHLWFQYTYHYHLLVHRREGLHEDWRRGTSSVGNTNTPKLLMGLAYDLNDVTVAESFDGAERWWTRLFADSPDDAVFKVWLARELPLPDRALEVGRTASALASLLALLVTVVYVARVTHPALAVLGCVYLARLPLFSCARLMADSYVLLFLALTVLAYDLLVHPPAAAVGRGRPWRLALYTVVAGATMGAKLSCFVVLGFLPAAVALEVLRERGRKGWSRARFAALHVAALLAGFCALHPQTWRNPAVGLYRFFELQLRGLRGEGVTVSPATVLAEYRYQVGSIAGHCHLWTWLVVALIAAGVLACLLERGGRGGARRFAPLLIVAAVFPLALSSAWDERYTWFLTVTLGVLMLLGLDLLARGAAAVVVRAAGSAGGEPPR